jgi:hypothetical protein
MIARIARWDPFPDTPWVAEVGCAVPGMLALYHVIDDRDGSGLSISIAADQSAIDRATQAIIAENARRGPDGFRGGPTEVLTYRVHAAANTHTAGR